MVDDDMSVVIPEDLIIEILCYLPVKTLKGFCIVCKSWRYLINTDPKFAFKHYLTNTSSSSTPAKDFILNAHCKGPCMFSLSTAVEEETKKRSSNLKRFDSSLSLSMKGCCHGIICFYSEPKHRILLCNPSIQEVVVLPSVPKELNWACHAGLGFDPLTQDYKVVVVSVPPLLHPLSPKPQHRSLLWEVAIYSMRSGHWRVLPPNPLLKDCLMLSVNTQAATSNANGRICNWLVQKTVFRLEILTFDMVEEDFKVVSMPTPPQCQNHEHQLFASDSYQACLCCYSSSSSTSTSMICSFTIWVLKNEDHNHNYWSKQFCVEEIVFPRRVEIEPLNFWLNNKSWELVILAEHNNPDDNVQILEWEVFHYDLATHQLKPNGSFPWFSGCTTFVESLISIRGFISPSSSSLLHNSNNNDDEDNNKDYCFFRETGRFGSVRWSCRFKLT